jgi:hypothetical protein
VPALRVLEEKSRPRKDGEPVDVVDERGLVDGVKVARKCSKANVLGKAVEYIRYGNSFERLYPLMFFSCTSGYSRDGNIALFESRMASSLSSPVL